MKERLEISYLSRILLLTFVELGQLREREQQQAEKQRKRADDAIAQLERERQRAENERQRADEASVQLEALKAQLRQRGLEWED